MNENKIDKPFFQRGRKLLKQKQAAQGSKESKMLEVPAKFAEMITEQFKVQCIYAEKGCKEAIPFKVRKV